MKYAISRDYWFSAAHVIPGHEKCGRLHGHNYKVRVVVSGETLDEQGMLIDYAELDKYTKLLVEMVDHMFIVGEEDENSILVEYIEHASPQSIARINRPHSTAEDLAHLFFTTLTYNLNKTGIRVQEVTVWETPKSRATCSPN